MTDERGDNLGLASECPAMHGKGGKTGFGCLQRGTRERLQIIGFGALSYRMDVVRRRQERRKQYAVKPA